MINSLSLIISKLARKETKNNICHFAAIMDAATEMSYNNPNHLPKLIKIIARKIQANYMSAPLYYKTKIEIDDNLSRLYESDLLFDYSLPLNGSNQQLMDFMDNIDYCRPLELKTDLLLPRPRSRKDLITNLCTRVKGDWRQTSDHLVEYWLPIGIGFVNGGNHSITSGIINGEGIITDYDAYDISKIYEHVYCDGKSYLRKSDNSIISVVNSLEFAAIFEIGRLMLKHGVSA